jgi:alkanesulfonate monooxygenase SsuD/methylene tetrahydromethanopterin reductase-like flavin-dependent oxidoreductase (luciferase family)
MPDGAYFVVKDVAACEPRFGLFLNNRGAVFLGEQYTLSALIELAAQAEELGFDFVSVGDSVLAKPRYSAIPTLAAVAAATYRIGLTTGILQPHLRQPVLLAQEWATLDVVSGGRTVLGVGLGTGPRDLVDAELALAGLTRKTRARAFEESIALLKALWRGGPTSFHGRIFNVDNVDIGFGVARPEGVKISIACGAYIASQRGYGPNDVFDAARAGTIVGPFERVARLGDGWISGIATVDEWSRAWLTLRDEGKRLGRDLDVPDFERRFNTYIYFNEDSASARAQGAAFMTSYHRLPMDPETVERWLICGSPEQCARQIVDFIDAGVNSFQFILASPDQSGQLQLLAETIDAVRSTNGSLHH